MDYPYLGCQKAVITDYAKDKEFKSAIRVSAAGYMKNHLSKSIATVLVGCPFIADDELSHFVIASTSRRKKYELACKD